VLEAMRRDGYNVGGEQSGHIILSDYATTGDGLIAALQILAEIVQAGAPASEVLHRFDPLPQRLKSVRYTGAPLEDDGVKALIAKAEAELNGKGRLLIRRSGTEPVIRVMAEGDDPAQVEAVVDRICAAVEAA
jgi:phosphoglucosamine mutase